MSGEQPPLRRSGRLASIIPASRWRSMGHNETEARSLEQLQRDMKKYRDGMAKNRDGEWVRREDGTRWVLLEGLNFPRGERHNELMLPHWIKFADWLKSEGDGPTKLMTSGIAIPNQVWDVLLPALCGIRLRALYLAIPSRGTSLFRHLSLLLRENDSLVSLSVSGENITDLEVAREFSDALECSPSIERIFLSREGPANIDVLRTLFTQGFRGLKKIRLDRTPVGSEGASIVADFISENHCSVKEIQLARAGISDSDTIILATAVRKNSHLLTLDLCENSGISGEGRKNLLRAPFDPTSMDSIVASNHTCRIFAYRNRVENLASEDMSYDEAAMIVINEGDISEREKIRKKVVYALRESLQGDHFDVGHLNGVPLKLMPRLLALLQEHPMNHIAEIPTREEQEAKANALSMLFHTLRGWEMPSLFVNLRAPHGACRGPRSCL